MLRLILLACLLPLSTCLVPTLGRAAEPRWTFTLQYDPALHPQPYTGRVYLFFSAPTSEGNQPEPRFGPNWLRPQPFVSHDIVGWTGGQPLTLSLSSPGLKKFPANLTEDDLAGRNVQAVVRFNKLDPDVGTGAGNGFSRVMPLRSGGDVQLHVVSIVPEDKLPEGAWAKLLRVRSDLLSDFHGRDVYLQGSVSVPASYASQPDRRYPVILEVPGFGGNHLYRLSTGPVRETNTLGVEFIRVMLDPRCPLGHHVFANSANNGPYGDAFIQEFLPELDRQYRTQGAAGRLLTGHSSGGWSTLWLQVNYPEHFAATWSTAPDPVDFRNFQQIDLYRSGENMFTDREGHRRPIARANGRPLVFYDSFSEMEDVLGQGGQLCSFDAVFSHRGSDHRAEQLWDHKTGTINPHVANTWKAYDINLLLKKNWSELGPQLAGKINIFMGTEDTFYLEGATMLLKTTLAELGSDAVVVLVPGKNHSNLMGDGLRERIAQQMAAKIVATPAGTLQKSN